MTTRGKRAVCPDCGFVADDYTALDEDHTPEAGNVSICLECDGVAVFTGDGLEIRPLTASEEAEMLHDPDVIRARIASAVTRFLQRTLGLRS